MKNERKEELKDEMKNKISMTLKDPILQQGFEIICKENAELKERIQTLEQIKKEHTDYTIKVEEERTSVKEQFTKAKKIIKDLCGMVRELNKPNVQLTNVDYSLSEAEQFLKEVEGCSNSMHIK